MIWNSELNGFKGKKFVDAISNKLLNGLFGADVYKTFERFKLTVIINNIRMN